MSERRHTLGIVGFLIGFVVAIFLLYLADHRLLSCFATLGGLLGDGVLVGICLFVLPIVACGCVGVALDNNGLDVHISFSPVAVLAAITILDKLSGKLEDRVLDKVLDAGLDYLVEQSLIISALAFFILVVLVALNWWIKNRR